MGIDRHPKWASNNRTQNFIVLITNRQAEYFAKNGKYFQGLRIPSTGALDGDAAAAINYGLKPTDQDDSWNTFAPNDFKASTRLRFHLAIDVYQHPEGMGWILTIDLFSPGLGPDNYGIDGDHWVYRHNHGPMSQSGIWDEWYIQPETPGE